jgi:hypothetical protein
VKRSFGEFENLLSDAEIFLLTVASRVLATTVDDNALSMVARRQYAHFTRPASEASAGVIDFDGRNP